MPRWLVRVLFGCLAAYATYAVTIQQLQKPITNVGILSAIVLAVSALRDVVGGIEAGGIAGISKQRMANIQEELVAILVALYEPKDAKGNALLKTPCFLMGIHIFLIPRRYRTRVGQFLVQHRQHLNLFGLQLLRPTMRHLTSIRLKDEVDMSGIKWRAGKGDVGLCWVERRPVAFNFAEYADYTSEQWDIVRDEWARNGQTDIGLSHEERVTMERLYASVLAVPLCRKNGQQIGCVALDVPQGYTGDFTLVRAKEIVTRIGKQDIAPLVPRRVFGS